MAQTVEHTQVTTSTAPTGSRVATGASGDFFAAKTNQIIFSLAIIIDLLILLRLLFLLAGANRVGIVSFILNITEVFVAPFRGIFPSPSVEGAYFEVASIVAMIMYLVFAYILGLVINMFSSSTEVE
jgi:hypothetical protein